MEERKEPPSAEASLRSMSWHLKCLVEEIKSIKQDLSSLIPPKGSDCPF